MIELNSLTCKEIKKLAAGHGIHIGIRTVQNWAWEGRFGNPIAYRRQSPAYDAKNVKIFLKSKYMEIFNNNRYR